jgi:hypothetical protein
MTLPVPLAQLQQRAWNAKTPLERHQAAYHLWEASLRLLGSVAVARYAELKKRRRDLTDLLTRLACPTLEHWCKLIGETVPELAEAGDGAFGEIWSCLSGPLAADWKHAPHLHEALVKEIDSGAKGKVGVEDLFEALLDYRREGLAQAGRQSERERMGALLLGGVGEVLRRIDTLAGHALVYVHDVRRQASGNWLIEHYDLSGETVQRAESLEWAPSQAARLPSPQYVYIYREGEFLSLHPLVVYDFETGEVFFAHAPPEGSRLDHLCFSSGRLLTRDDTPDEQRKLLERVLGHAVDANEFDRWAARSRTQAGRTASPARRASWSRTSLSSRSTWAPRSTGGAATTARSRSSTRPPGAAIFPPTRAPCSSPFRP